MGIKTGQVGQVAAASAAVQTQIDTQLDPAIAAVSGAFWPDPVGKVVLTYTLAASGSTFQNTGILLSPTAAVWSTFPWRWEVIESVQGYVLAAKVYSGFITFSDVVGNPSVRFGSGTGDPGFSSNGPFSQVQGFNYNLQNSGSVILLANGSPDRPISISSSGEIVLWITNNESVQGFAKGVFTVGQEVILPAAPQPPTP